MEEKKKDFLSLEEVRNITKTSTRLNDRIAKEIKNAAYENRNHLVWDVHDVDPEVIKSITDELQSKGYKAGYLKYKENEFSDEEIDYNCLEISW